MQNRKLICPCGSKEFIREKIEKMLVDEDGEAIRNATEDEPRYFCNRCGQEVDQDKTALKSSS